MDAIDAWRKQMQIQSLTICGHSFGAYIAASYAMQKSSQCERLLLVDPWGMPERDPDTLKNAPLSRKVLIGTLWALSSWIEPVTLLQLSGSYSWFAKSRARMVRKLDERTQDDVIQYLYHSNAHASPSGPRAFSRITGPLACEHSFCGACGLPFSATCCGGLGI